MGRRTIVVDKAKLENAITIVEKDGGLENLTTLFQKVAEVYNTDNPPENITFSVVGLRVKEWNIQVKTTPGRRGRQPGEGMNVDGHALAAKRAKNKKAKFNSENAHLAFVAMREKTPERFHPLINRIEKGSRAAAAKLFCLQCVGFETKEVRECTSKECPMYLFRPYQNSDDDAVEIGTPENDNISVDREEE